uniref:Homer protein n=1 Tax=Fagus sylvatica TaxID=28930 RepID=A0A2N9FZC2_FAGSY
MPTTIKLSLIPSPNPKTLSSITFPITSLISRRACLRPRILIVKCNNSGQSEASGGNLKDALAGMVDKQVDEFLNREENRVLLDGLEKASQRVEMAKRELAEIEKQELEAKQMRDYINQLESQASEIAECQREILEAGEMVEKAERSLGLNVDGSEDGDAFLEKESEEIDRNEEKVESIKAAVISGLVGTLAGLPISFTQVTSSSQLILPLAINFVSCALFGVTFRYTIRRDLDNIHLKTGTSAAFGFVKGLAMLGSGPPLELNTGSFLSHGFDGAVFVSENLFLFVFATVGLDYCFKAKLLSPFPIKRSVSR